MGWDAWFSPYLDGLDGEKGRVFEGLVDRGGEIIRRGLVVVFPLGISFCSHISF